MKKDFFSLEGLNSTYKLNCKRSELPDIFYESRVLLIIPTHLTDTSRLTKNTLAVISCHQGVRRYVFVEEDYRHVPKAHHRRPEITSVLIIVQCPMGGSHLDWVPSISEYHSLNNTNNCLSNFFSLIFVPCTTKKMFLYFIEKDSTHHMTSSWMWIQSTSTQFLQLFVVLTNEFYLFFSWGLLMMMNIWWLLIWPVSSTSLFLFLFFLSTHPSEQNHPYLTLSFGSQTHKVCNTVIPGSDPSLLCPAMNGIWLCITSVLSFTRVFCDQSFDTSRIRGRLIQLFCLSFIHSFIILSNFFA